MRGQRSWKVDINYVVIYSIKDIYVSIFFLQIFHNNRDLFQRNVGSVVTHNPHQLPRSLLMMNMMLTPLLLSAVLVPALASNIALEHK